MGRFAYHFGDPMVSKRLGPTGPSGNSVPPDSTSVLLGHRSSTGKTSEKEDPNPLIAAVTLQYNRTIATLTGRDAGAEVSGPPGKCHQMVADFHCLVGALEEGEKGLAKYALTYLRESLLSKYDSGAKSSAERRRKAAYVRFWEAESMCAAINRGTWVIQRQIPDVVDDARRHIRAVLGNLFLDSGQLNPAIADRLVAHQGFGPGGTTSLPRRKGDAAYKYRHKPDCTSYNIAWAHAAVRFNDPWWRECFDSEAPFEDQVHLVPGNVVCTVPKNDKTDRVIASEPDLNMYVQKGFGGYIRERLKRFGVDLNDQSRNQEFARLGSESDTRQTHGVDDSYACIDLSMASDTVSTGVVRMLLPPDWVHALEQARSPYGVLPDECVACAPDWAKPGLASGLHYYQKFSSMGNGFTFELESLIFWALARAVTDRVLSGRRPVAVYGDDIIVPTAAYPQFVRVLKLVGFKTNLDKTYAGYGFRESCGKHFYLGHDVTPFFVRRPVVTLTDAFLFLNNIERWRRVQTGVMTPATLLTIQIFMDAARGLLPGRWRKPRIPDGFGDGALIGFFDQCLPTVDPNGTEHFRCRVVATEPQHDFRMNSVGLLVKALNKACADLLWGWYPDDRRPARVNPVRGERHRVKTILIPWCNFP